MTPTSNAGISLVEIATLATAVATPVVAVVTAWMAYETRRMASAAQRTLLHDREPLFGIAGIQVAVVAETAPSEGNGVGGPVKTLTGIRVGVNLVNAGRVAIRYRLQEMRLTFAGRTTDSPTYLSRTGRILPQLPLTFWHPTFSFDPVAAFPSVGRLSCTFEYWADGESVRRIIVQTFQYTVFAPAIGAAVEWVFVDPEPAA